MYWHKFAITKYLLEAPGKKPIDRETCQSAFLLQHIGYVNKRVKPKKSYMQI